MKGEGLMHKRHDDISQEELRQRVIYALLLPVTRLAHTFGVNLKALRGLLDTAYFQELRGAGLTHREIGDLLQVSERTAVKLSRQSREQYVAPSMLHNLPRRIEFMLGAEPMGHGRIRQLLPEVSPEHIDAAIGELLEQGRVTEVPGRTLKFTPAALARSLPRDTWLVRLGALNSFTENLTNAVFGRFFQAEPRTFARTLTLRGGPETFETLDAFYKDTILPGLRAMHRDHDKAYDAPDEMQQAQVSLCWAPYEHLKPSKTNDTEGES